MNVAVSYDEEGNILTLFDPEALSTDAGFFTYVPAPGEEHRVLDLPAELEATPILELPNLLRVNRWGQLPRLERRHLPARPVAEPSANIDPRRRSGTLGEVAD